MLYTEQLIATNAVHFVNSDGREITAHFHRWKNGDYAWLLTDDPNYRNILAAYSDRREKDTWHFAH